MPGHVHGLSMPSRYSSTGSVTDADRPGGAPRHRPASTSPSNRRHGAFASVLAGALGEAPSGLTDENLQSRIRGVVLMAVSNARGWIVLTTGNKSELATGYSTLYGDSAGGFAVIKDVPKTLVYRLCRYRNARAGNELIPESVLTKAPSAELRPDQRDDQSLPPYEVLDPLLDALVLHDRSIARCRRRAGTTPTSWSEWRRSSTAPSTSAGSHRPASASRPRRSARIGVCRSRTATATPPPRPRRWRPTPTRPARGDPACLTVSTRPGSPWAEEPSTAWGPRGPALSLEAQARLVGSYQWVERRLFEVLGSWVASEPVPEAQVLFDVYSQQHAWHAELFADRLPALDSVDPATLVLPPSPEVDAHARRAGRGRCPTTTPRADTDGTWLAGRTTRRCPPAARCPVSSASAGWCWPGSSPGTPCICGGSRPSPTRP